jgi:hypothetical protein
MLSTSTIEARLQAISSRGWGTGVGESQPAAIVAEVESLLAVRLPPEYKEFLQHFGYLSVTDRYVCGIVSPDLSAQEAGNVVYETLNARESLGIPNHLVVISRDHDDHGYAICLDLRDIEREAPVVCWDPSVRRTTRWYRSFEPFLLEHLLDEADA